MFRGGSALESPHFAPDINIPHANEDFCSYPRCVLHVSAVDDNVEGHGEWATLPDGRISSRVKVGDRYFCHVCAEDPNNVPQAELFDK